MPSASAKLEKQTSTEAYDPIKQIVTIVEKKIRNLEKRKGKLDAYRQDSVSGKELNEDQKKAVEKYDQVVELLDFAKDFQKQFNGVVQESTKAQKKAAKREQLERMQLESQRIKEIMVYQDLLSSMGSDDIRQDFLEGNKGAVKLSEEDLNGLDELYKVMCPERDADSSYTEFDSTLITSAEHIQALLDGKNKEAFGTTYKNLRETLQKIYTCSYFNKSEEPAAEESESSAPALEESDTTYEEQLHEMPKSQEINVEECSIAAKPDDFLLQKPADPSPLVERPYFPMENSSVFVEPPRPIQEVLSGQGNLNFLQESQIEVEASCAVSPSHMVPPTYGGMQYPASAQPLVPQHRLPESEDPQQQPMLAAPAVVTVPASDFDPGRPIPTQTYTNQSFSSVVHHPLMFQHPAHPHVMPVMQPMPQRGGMPTVPLVTQVLNSESTQATRISPQYECSEIQDNNVVKHSSSFGNNSSNHAIVGDSRNRPGANAYPRAATQVEFGSDRGYQSTNNSQAYMSRETFGDGQSYSSNLKRGLPSRGGARGPPRGTSHPPARGARIGYRN